MVNVRMNETSMAHLKEALAWAATSTKLANVAAAKSAAYQICRSAAAGSKPKSMAAKRELVPVLKQRGSVAAFAAGWAQFLIRVRHQDGGDTFISTSDRNDKKRTIKMLGLAASVWRFAAGKFGKAATGGASVPTTSRRVVVQKSEKSNSVAIRIINKLSYIEEAFPGVIDKAVDKGMISFIGRFDKTYASYIKQKWAA